MKEPKLVVNQNIQLIAVEQREPEPTINIVMCNGLPTNKIA